MISIVSESDVLKASGGPLSRTARMGPEGQRVLDNVRNVLRAFNAWGEEKNGDDLIQNFFVNHKCVARCDPADIQYNAATADLDIDVNAPSTPSSKELSRDGQRAISSLRTIANLLVTNPEFRNLISDFILLARDIFADAASSAADGAKQAAEKTRPTEQERKQGVDLDGLAKKGKNAAGKAKKTSGKEVTDSLWGEVEDVKSYLDDKLPDGDEAKEKIINRLQQVSYDVLEELEHS